MNIQEHMYRAVCDGSTPSVDPDMVMLPVVNSYAKMNCEGRLFQSV